MPTKRNSPAKRTHITEDVLASLDERESAQVIASIERHQSFNGPLPHPATLQGYEDVLKGSAERIVQMAEKEQAARLANERDAVQGEIKANARGQWMGFIIAILFFVGAVVLGLCGQPWLGGILGGSTLVSIVVVFASAAKKDKAPAED